MDFKQVDKVQIRFNDIDLLGHVNNAIIGEYFDLGRMNYLHRVFDGIIGFKEESLVIVSIQTQFFKPILLSHQVQVMTKVYQIGGKSLKFKQLVIGSDGTIFAESYSVMVSISLSTKESIPVPSKWREMILAVDSDCINDLSKS